MNGINKIQERIKAKDISNNLFNLFKSGYRVATLVSARVAELVAIKYYKNLGQSAEDISITQLDGNSQDWKSHDLSVNLFRQLLS